MINAMSKRLITALLAVLLVVSVFPAQAFAWETGEQASEEILEPMDPNAFTETVLLKQVKSEMEALLIKYLGTTLLSQVEVEDAVYSMDEDQMVAAWEESAALGETAEGLTDAEVYFLKLNESTQTFGYFYEVLSDIFNSPIALYAASGTHKPVTGVTVGVSGATDNSMSGGAVTVTAKGSGGIFGYGASAKTATITIYNETGSKATVAFNWTATSVYQLKIDGTAYSGSSGSFSKTLEAGASFVVTITTEKNNTTNKLVMSAFTATAVKESSNVTFVFDETLGSVSVDGNAVANGDVVAVAAAGATIKATPASGVTFLGWIDGNNKIVNKSAECKLEPADDMSVKAVFVTNAAWFLVNGDCLYEGLNAAVNAVANVTNKTIVAANNGTIPAGNYTIPSGVTLLIPYDDINTLHTTAPGITDATYKKPTTYRTLTMASGAHITVNGAISLSAVQSASGGVSAPTSTVSMLKMESDSTITVNSGANLYAWGFITGSGSVLVKNGATVYECFQVTNWRGGTNASEMVGNSYRVFPINQYYVQNVEVPMTMEAGAVENGYMSVSISLVGLQGSAVPFIGPNGMFNITSGTLTKDYDEMTDRLVIDIDGEIAMQSLSISMKLSLLGTKTINSKDYDLPVTSNLTVNIKDGGKATITQDIAMLPGSEINVEKGAQCILGKGYNIYVYDADEWALNYFATGTAKVAPVKYAPGKPASVPFHTADDDAHIHIAGTIDASQGYTYVTASGASITAEDGAVVLLTPGTKTTTYQVYQGGSDGKDLQYISIPIQSVQLVENDTGLGGKYEYVNGAWVKTQCNHNYTSKVTVAPGCETQGEKTFTCPCGDSYTEAIAATGHTAVIDAVKAPTCTEPGLTQGSHCSVCNKVLAEQQVVPATGHTKGADANCTDAQTCTVCGTQLAAALGHAYVETVVPPTCTADGYTNHTCSRCGDSYNDETVVATGHTEVIDAAVDPTCTETGLTQGAHCSVCNTVLVEQQVVSATGHSLPEGASCTHAGTCGICGVEVGEPLGHDYGTVVTAPTCTEQGYTTHTCSRCKDTYVDSYIDANGHSEVIDEAVDATCTQTGLTQGSHCSVCGHVFVAQEVVPVLPHNYTTKVTAPTCTEQGYTTYTCGCGDTYIADYVKENGHTAGAEATCTQPQICTVCSAVLNAALGHAWQEIPAKVPSRTENGYEAYRACEVCGEVEGEIVILPALGEASVTSYDQLIYNLTLLEEIAGQYVKQNPGKNPIALIIKYIRTGVDRYNSGSWGIMAGYEDADFANYVRRMEDMVNAEVTDGNYVAVTGLKNIENFNLPNGNHADIGHVFGAMDITYHNKGSVNHADVSGWAGDLVDLMEVADLYGVSGDLDTMIATIAETLLGKNTNIPQAPSMSQEDIDGDLDAYYIMQTLYGVEEDYAAGLLAEIFTNYYTETLSNEQRAAFFLRNRLETTGTRAQVRNAVYAEYTGNKLIATLEGTREFKTSDLSDLRRAACYAFADYVCRLAGDYVEKIDNPYYEVFASSMSVLAPGITRESYQATTADGKQIVYHVATADLNRDDVFVRANYHNSDPSQGWAMQRVLDQANAAQKRYGDPNSADYIPNYNVIVSTNADGFNMSTGEPGGLLIMDGKEWHAIDNGGFFGITKEGKAVIGTKDDYNNTYKDQLTDAVGGFGTMLIKDGKIAVSRTDSYYSSRAPRTAVGLTRTGKVVLMVLDGRQEPFSCGGSMEEIAQIMFEAGCVEAVNLDGGGSTTFVSKEQGAEELAVLNRPSDGAARSVSTSLLMISTAPSSTAFDHANLVSDYTYSTIGTSVQLTPVGISATGNETELPEGYVWEISDEKWGTITQDGLFTGLRNGSVDVYLKLDGAIIGSKTMNIVVPENVYFTRKTMDAVYGSSVKLPVAALYQGKAVAINQNDVVLSLENNKAGSINGFEFTAKEGSNLKVAKVTVNWAGADEVLGDVITINLYNQGENTFDFDKATGGDRQLAWYRSISNSTTDDNVNYVAIDSNKDMVATYTFAMDMTQIPIPSQLSDLVYMLPGADSVDASAWNFLLQLAERVSTLSEVTPVLRFDPNVNVDYSELKIVNDYFELTSTQFDEVNNTLTLKLRWIDQTAAIDPATANPLCLVSGVKITPKADAKWDTNKRLNIVHSGEISYNIYLRANALYSFAQKKENQEIYGLKPFVNPNLPSESGAYFGDVYNTFEDTYTLVNAKKNGWQPENGGFAYYIEGVKLAGGVKNVDGYYYYFNDQGINNGQTKYTGVFHDDANGVYRYAKLGVLETGWQLYEGSWYYFDKSTKAAVSGTKKVGGVTYEFYGDGKLVSGVWLNTLDGGKRYYYGPNYYSSKWQQIDGEWYYFRNGKRITGYSIVDDKEVSYIRKWYNFGEDGIAREMEDGVYYIDGIYYYIENGLGVEKYLIKVGNDYYYATYGGKVAVNKTVNTYKSNCDLPKGTYTFGPDGKMIGASAEGSIVEIDGELRYFENGVGVQKGLVKVGNDYYYTVYGGKLGMGKIIDVQSTSCDLPKGRYEFGPDGKMLQGVVEKDGKLYYYENGVGVQKGLFEYNGDYYYSAYRGELAVGKIIDAQSTSCNLPKGRYEFATDGKMLQGVVDKNGKLYYYENGTGVQKGLFEYNGDYYYSAYRGELAVGKTIDAQSTSCDLPKGRYEFAVDGKMLQGVVEKDGKLYYYENGVGVQKGLFEYNGDYYYSAYRGELALNKTIDAQSSSCDLTKGRYEFGADGKMIQGLVEKDGVLYYYENGQGVNKGLIKIGEDYYYTTYGGKIAVGKVLDAQSSSCDLPKGRYEFGLDGKMLQGVVEKDGKLYYYENGQGVERGLVKFGDDYYYIAYKGEIALNKLVNVKLTSCDLPTGRYEFGADGKMLQGIVNKDGVLYYYENGQGVQKGLFYLDGYYYYSVYGGKLAVNKQVGIIQGNGLLIEKTYTFNELGQIIA